MPEIILNDKDEIIFERASGGRYDVRLRGGKNSEGKDTVVATVKPGETLVISGSGKEAEITLPDNIGIDPGDPIPRIQLNTENPVRVIGAGKFTVAKESTQAAVIEVSPVNLTAMTVHVKDNKPVIAAAKHSPKESDDKTTQQLSFKDERSGRLRTVTVENKTKDAPGGEIIFVSPHDDKELFKLSGKEPLAKNNMGFQKLMNTTKADITKAFAKDSAEEKKRLGLGKDTPAEAAEPSSSPAESKPAAKESGDARKDVTKAIDEIGKKITQIKSQPPQKRLMDSHESIRNGIKSLEEAVKAVASTHGNPSKEQKEALHDALDNVISAATEAEKNKKDVTNQAAARILKTNITKMKQDIEKIEGLKISMAAPGLPETALVAARQATHPSLAGNSAVAHADQNTIAVPATETHLPGSYRTV